MGYKRCGILAIPQNIVMALHNVIYLGLLQMIIIKDIVWVIGI